MLWSNLNIIVWKHTLVLVEGQNAISHGSSIVSVGVGGSSSGIFSTASMSFRDIPLSSLRIIVYSRVLIFSAFETVVWFLWVWILGFRTLFFLFRTYRGMQLWWDSSTYIWANERGCIKYLCFFHIRDYLCRGSRRALGPQWKLLSTSDSNHSLYAQKGSFAFTPGQARQAYNKHCLHK